MSNSDSGLFFSRLVGFGLAFFGGGETLFTGFAAEFGGPFARLRFEPTLQAKSFFSEFYEIGEAAAEGPFMGGGVAQEQVELVLGGSGREVGGEAGLLEAKGALVKPIVPGHVVHEHRFGRGGGLVLFAQVGVEFVEFFRVLVGEEDEGAGQAVAEVVLGGDGFASFGARAGGELGILTVGFDLALGEVFERWTSSGEEGSDDWFFFFHAGLVFTGEGSEDQVPGAVLGAGKCLRAQHIG